MKYKMRIAGSGGQSVIFAAKILVRAAELGGFKTIWLPTQVSEMRGSEASCGIVLAKEPYARYDSCDADILIAMSRQAILRFGDNKNSITITDERFEKLCGGGSVVCVNTAECGQGAAFEGLNNLLMIGAMLAETDIIKSRDVYKALKEHISGRAAERNINAVEYGRQKAYRKRLQREIV
ncbi:MAG: 2-oxoacid:acceptor oxidoreductase family protein [Candidatus Ornithomonoglobus sp.]